MEGDEPTLRPKMWQSLLTDSAFYFDRPTVQQEQKMRTTLQHRYDGLFPEGWRAPLTSRTDLVSWVCEQQNAFLAERDAPAEMKWECDNPGALIDQYGPDYASVRAKLGFIKGLYRQ